MGRPTKLNADVCDRLAAAVASGASVKAAADWLGLHPDTVSRWRSTGRRAWVAAGLEGSDPTEEELVAAVGEDQVFFVRVFRALQRAEVAPRIRASSSLAREIENGNWRAAMRYVKRRPRRDRESYQPPPVRVCRQGSAKPGGRPSKLSPEVHAELVRLASLAVFAVDAAASVGISEATYHRWMRRGETAYESTCVLLEAQWRAEGDDLAYATPEGVIEELERSDPDEIPYVRLYRDVRYAEAVLSMKARAVWFDAGYTDWRAPAEMLAWDYPDRWGPNALSDEEWWQRELERQRALLEGLEPERDEAADSPPEFEVRALWQLLAEAGVDGFAELIARFD